MLYRLLTFGPGTPSSPFGPGGPGEPFMERQQRGWSVCKEGQMDSSSIPVYLTLHNLSLNTPGFLVAQGPLFLLLHQVDPEQKQVKFIQDL